MHGKLSFLNQHVFDLGFEDTIASLLESYLSDSLKISDFIISLVFVGEYDFLKKFISLLYFCYCLLINETDEIILVLNLFEWWAVEICIYLSKLQIWLEVG